MKYFELISVFLIFFASCKDNKIIIEYEDIDSPTMIYHHLYISPLPSDTLTYYILDPEKIKSDFPEQTIETQYTDVLNGYYYDYKFNNKFIDIVSVRITGEAQYIGFYNHSISNQVISIRNDFDNYATYNASNSVSGDNILVFIKPKDYAWFMYIPKITPFEYLRDEKNYLMERHTIAYYPRNYFYNTEKYIKYFKFGGVLRGSVLWKDIQLPEIYGSITYEESCGEESCSKKFLIDPASIDDIKSAIIPDMIIDPFEYDVKYNISISNFEAKRRDVKYLSPSGFEISANSLSDKFDTSKLTDGIISYENKFITENKLNPNIKITSKNGLKFGGLIICFAKYTFYPPSYINRTLPSEITVEYYGNKDKLLYKENIKVNSPILFIGNRKNIKIKYLNLSFNKDKLVRIHEIIFFNYLSPLELLLRGEPIKLFNGKVIFQFKRKKS